MPMQRYGPGAGTPPHRPDKTELLFRIHAWVRLMGVVAVVGVILWVLGVVLLFLGFVV